MPRQDDIRIAFMRAIRIETNGRRTVTTDDFCREMRAVGWDMTRRQANEWIRLTTRTFKDISTHEGDDKTYMQYNPNGGL